MPAIDATRFPTTGPRKRNDSASAVVAAPPRRCAESGDKHRRANAPANTMPKNMGTIVVFSRRSSVASPKSSVVSLSRQRRASLKDVLDDEPDIRRPLGESAHVPRKPVVAVRNQHAQRTARRDQALL